MNPETADTLERSPLLRAVVIGSSALGLGVLFASLTGLEMSAAGLGFRWRWLAVPAFLAGAALAAGYWRLVFRLGAGADRPSARRRLYAASIFLLLLAGAIFLYPLRFVTADKRQDVLVGLAAAVVALSCVGFMIRTIVRLLEAEDANPPP